MRDGLLQPQRMIGIDGLLQRVTIPTNHVRYREGTGCLTVWYSR